MTKFNTRGFVSLLLSFTFLVSLVSGIVMWVHSPAVVFGLGVWKHAHMYVSAVMVLTAIVHFALNWSVYGSYWRRKISGRGWRWEFAAAVVLAVVVTAVAMVSAPAKSGRPGDPSQMTLQQLARTSGRPVEKIVDLLGKENIHVHDHADSLRKIAEHNNFSLEKLCALLEREVPEAMRPSRGPH
ncbi:MAG: DUF4405 domain-containing protein [Thermoguttaceae bacterium]